MSESKAVSNTGTAAKPRKFDLGELFLEGRAFLALIVIIIAFSLLSPNYFTASNFLIMASHVAIYGLLAIGMLLVVLNGGIACGARPPGPGDRCAIPGSSWPKQSAVFRHDLDFEKAGHV